MVINCRTLKRGMIIQIDLLLILYDALSELDIKEMIYGRTD